MDDDGIAVAVDGAGNIIVTGWANGGSGTHDDYATFKYSSAGVPLWTNFYNGPGNQDENATAMAVDGNGNVFVTGRSYNGSGNIFNFDYATVAYSGTGVPLWTNRFNGPGNYWDQANAIAVDGNGNVFVTGYSAGSGSSNDFTTIAYSGAGVPLWTNFYNGPGNGDDQAKRIVVDNRGNVFVTGYSTSSGGDSDYTTIKYAAITYSPIITSQPQSQTNTVGNTASLTMTASGTGPLAYQWFFNSNAVADATNNSLIFTNVARSNSGYYFVTVTNDVGSTSSSNALLTVGGVAQSILPLTPLGGGRYRVSFLDFDGGLLFPWDLSNLEIEVCSDLGVADWMTLPKPIVISNGVGQVEFLVTNTPPQQFYRIRMR